MGVMLHLLGDLMTHMKFKPLWPIRNNEIAWHWFYLHQQDTGQEKNQISD